MPRRRYTRTRADVDMHVFEDVADPPPQCSLSPDYGWVFEDPFSGEPIPVELGDAVAIDNGRMWVVKSADLTANYIRSPGGGAGGGQG